MYYTDRIWKICIERAYQLSVKIKRIGEDMYGIIWKRIIKCSRME